MLQAAFSRSPASLLQLARPMPASARLAEMFRQHVDFVARSLRRLGVAEPDLEDATQEVFVVASRKLSTIELGAEKAFLFGTAMRLASNARRSRRRSRESLGVDTADEADVAPAAEELLDRRRARETLDGLLSALDDDARAVFALHEIEGLTAAEIATIVGIPPGTVASRLRRARVQFDEGLAALQARLAGRVGP